MHYFENKSVAEFFQTSTISVISIGYGIEIGICYAFLALLILSAPIFETIPTRVDKLVQSMNLNILDAVFLSICAGVGEELLFRAGIQYYVGPFISSILFVAIHGYLNPLNFKKSLYGFVVLPFSFILCYGYEEFGLWFSISAHFAYDLVLFVSMTKSVERE